MKLPDSEDITAIEDQAQAARFREVKAKMAQDAAAMTAFNAQVESNKKRCHVVAVMHEKGQLQVGREPLGNIFSYKGLKVRNFVVEVLQGPQGFNLSAIKQSEACRKLHGEVAPGSQCA